MPLSRRQFLQLTGIAFVGTAFDLPALPAPAMIHGRTLAAVPVYTRPDRHASITHYLWPDTVLPITTQSGGWYRTSDGYIEKTSVQPVMLDNSLHFSPHPQHLPIWAEVSAPAAAIRAWCAADAPLITRIGHGGVMQIIDQLPGDPHWYGAADEHGRLLGWTQASGWRQVHPHTSQAPLEIQIDQRRLQMRVISDGATMLRADISTGQRLLSGDYTILRHAKPGIRTDCHYGAAWPLRFGDNHFLVGVYWHNQFGKRTPGPAVQVPVYLAHWLYQACASDSVVSVF